MFMAQNNLLNVFNLNLNQKIFLQLRKNFNQATSLLCTVSEKVETTVVDDANRFEKKIRIIL